MTSELARVLDPSELDALTGPHGKMSITLPASEKAEEVVVVVPPRIACGRCDGGGCDACGRSGALRIDLPEAERTTHFIFSGEARDVRIRLARPIAALDLLTLEVRVTREAGLALRSPDALARGGGGGLELRSVLVAIGLALAAAVAFAMTR